MRLLGRTLSLLGECCGLPWPVVAVGICGDRGREVSGFGSWPQLPGCGGPFGGSGKLVVILLAGATHNSPQPVSVHWSIELLGEAKCTYFSWPDRLQAVVSLSYASHNVKIPEGSRNHWPNSHKGVSILAPVRMRSIFRLPAIRRPRGGAGEI
jgi:hypothetical protein